MESFLKNSFRTENIHRGISYLKRNGLIPSYYKALERILRDKDEVSYNDGSVFDEIARKEQRELELSRSFTHSYKISIIVPTYETNEQYLREMVKSVIDQTYSNWELCIADASPSDKVSKVIDSLRDEYKDTLNEDKLKYKRLSENKGISDNTNEALKLATGEYIGLLDHDDVLTENALYEVMNVLETGLTYDGVSYTNKIKVIYSDEDKINSDMTKFFDYHKKTDFDIELLRTNNYICHFLVVRRTLALEAGGLHKEFDGSQDHDFILRCVENLQDDAICHIDKVLYHWRSHEQSTATNPESKLYAYEAGQRAVEAHLERMGIKASVSKTAHLGYFRVKYHVTGEQLADVAIMSLGELRDMSYDDLMAIDASYIMVQNDNVEPVDMMYIEEMLGNLIQDNVGCVGCLVIGKNGRIESAGYKKVDGKNVPEFANMNRNFSGYLHRAKLQRRVDAVCTDCMMIRKEALSEEKTLKQGFKVVYTPYCQFRRVR